MGGPELRFDHVVMPLFDAAATHRFYSQTLGMPLCSARSGTGSDGREWLLLIFGEIDGHQIALYGVRGMQRTPEEIPQDSRHYAFGAAGSDALASWQARLRKAGVEFRYKDLGTQKSIYFEDPNGNTIEIATPPSPPTTIEADAEAVLQRWLAGPVAGGHQGRV
jgi:catechol 2,3-dioxygenase-like lactoylglutathione lyase family enzyme